MSPLLVVYYCPECGMPVMCFPNKPVKSCKDHKQEEVYNES
jgi:hypothetical protein